MFSIKQCSYAYFSESSHQASSSSAGKSLEELLQQQKEGSYCDVVFLVGDQKVYGHRSVLAPLSPLIKHSDRTGDPLLTINFTGLINNHSALREVIQWFYNQDITKSLSYEKIEDFVEASFLLGINNIPAICVEFLVEKLCLRNVFQSWCAAKKIGLNQFSSLCEWIARERFQDTLIEIDETLEIPAADMKMLYTKGLYKKCSEIKWGEFVDRWIAHGQESSRSLLRDDLLQHTSVELEANWLAKEHVKEGFLMEPSEEIFVSEDSIKNEHFIYRPTTDRWVSVYPPNIPHYRVTAVGIKVKQNTRFILAEVRQQEYALIDPFTGALLPVNIFPLLPLIPPVTGLQIFFTIQNRLFAITDRRQSTMKYNIILWEYKTGTQTWNVMSKIIDRFGEACVAIEYIPRDDFGGFIITHTVPSDMTIHRLDVSKKRIVQQKTSPRNVTIGHLYFPGIDPAPLTLDIIGAHDKLYIVNPKLSLIKTCWVYDVNEDRWYPEMKIDTIPTEEDDPMQGAAMYSSTSGEVYIPTAQQEDIFPDWYSYNPFTKVKKSIHSMPHITRSSSIKMEVQRAPSKLLDQLPEATLKAYLDVALLDKWQKTRLVNAGRVRFGVEPLPEEPDEPPRPKSHVITPEMEDAYRQLQLNLRG